MPGKTCSKKPEGAGPRRARLPPRLGATLLTLASLVAHAAPPRDADAGTQARVEPGDAGAGSVSEKDVAAMRAWLTRSEWKTFRHGFGITNGRLIFTPEGLYRRTTFGEVVRDVVGHWRLELQTPLSGRLWLDEDNLTFARVGDELQVANNRFRPGDPRTEADVPKRPTSQPLQQGVFQRLSAHPWYRTDSSQPDVLPDSLVFTMDGRFTATYSQGACIDRGTLDLFVSGHVMTLNGGSTTCPAAHRVRTSQGYTFELRFDSDGRLHLGALGSYQALKPSPPGKQRPSLP